MLKIGDFSRLTRVSIRMLRYYDEIGLLKPQFIDNLTGYRFYSVDQFPRVNRIQVLRETGVSLSEISRLMAKDLDRGQLRSLLLNRRLEIAETIEKEKQKLLRVETLIKFIDNKDFSMNYEMTVKSIPAYKVISLRSIIPDYNAQGKLWDEITAFVEKNNIKCLTPYCAIHHDTAYKESDVDVEVTMCVNEDVVETDRITVRELEEVPEMAIVFHQGPFEELSLAYHKMGVWMSSNGYELGGPIRTIYHKGPCCEKKSANYLSEVQAPVIKMK